MSRIHIGDLSVNKNLDAGTMRALRGGNGWISGLGPAAVVKVGINQEITQFQNVEVNALNNVGVIGAGFGPLKLDVNPSQFANAAIAV